MIKKIGIILAGGRGTRLNPITKYINKHLMHIYNKPMIFYPLSLMILSGIKKIFIVINPGDLEVFEKLIKEEIKNHKVEIQFLIQEKPDGIVGGLKLLKKYISKNTKILTILGDNFLLGQGVVNNYILPAISSKKGCSIFTIYNKNPSKFGVLKLDKKKNPLRIVEKPKKFVSNDIVVGIYVFNHKFIDFIKNIKISKFNQFEVTDLINEYIKRDSISFKKLGKGTTWLDCGEFEELYKASQVVRFQYTNYGNDIGNFKK